MRQIVLIIEILILGITGFLPNEPTLNVIANIMLSFACAMQVDTFRKFRSIPCATTMCIGNMRSATEYLCLYHISKDPAMKYKSMHCGFIILVFAIGAAFGASCSAWFGVKAIWIAMAMQVVGFFMMFAHQDIEAFEKFEEEEKEKIRQTHARKKINMKLCLLLTCIYVYYLRLLLTHTKKGTADCSSFFSFSNFLPSRYFILREADSAHRSSSVLLL